MAGASSCSWPHGFPSTVLRAVEEAGASDLADLASLWTSREEAVQSSTDAGLSQELAALTGQLWALARCMESRPSCQTTSIAQPVSRVLAAPHVQLAHATLRLPAGPARPGVALRGPPLPFPKLRSGRVGGGVIQADSTQVPDRCLSVFEDIYELYVEAGSAGEFWMQADSADEEQTRRQLLATKIAKFQPAELRSKITAMTRWRQWLAASRWSQDAWASPSAACFGAALEQAATRRPTAGKALWDAGLWWKTYAGLPFPVHHGLVVAHRRPVQSHQPSTPATLEPWQFMNLLYHALSANGPEALFIRAVLVSAIATVRFRHAQRSALPVFDDSRISGRVQFGKRRQFGTRPGFTWSIPRFVLPQRDVFAQLQPFYSRVRDAAVCKHGQFPGLFPSICAGSRGYLAEDAQWCTKPMAPNTFNKFLNRALVSAEAFHVPVGSKCLRRFMPSLGEALEVGEEDAQAIGNWQDVPQGRGVSGVSRRRAIFPMGKHYASGTDRYPAVLKARLLAELFAIVKRLRPALIERGAYNGGMLRPGTLTWDSVHQAFNEHSRPSKRKSPELGMQQKEQVKVRKPSPQRMAPSSSSSSGSSSSSPANLSPQPWLPCGPLPRSVEQQAPPDGVAIVPESAHQDEWFRVSRRIHRLAFYTTDAAPVPVCQKASGAPLRGKVKEQGFGATSAAKAGRWCAKCQSGASSSGGI